MNRREKAILIISLLPACACGGIDEEENKGPACEANCQRQVAADCANTPDSYLSTCRSACASAREAIAPACRDELERLQVCVSTEISFSCSAAGIIQPTPIGACATEASACATCTGDVLQCFGL
jgi:hypothetical protein